MAAQWIELAEQSRALDLAPWSFSKLAALHACPKSFEYFYLQHNQDNRRKKDKYEAETAIAGKTVHNILENCVQLTGKESAPAVLDAFPMLFKECIRTAGLTHKEKDMVIYQRGNILAILKRVLTAVSTYNLAVTPEACISMDGNTGLFTLDHVPYKDRMFTLFIDVLGISRVGSAALVLDYKTYAKPKMDGKPKNKKRLARDKEQIEFYLMAVLGCFSQLKTVQGGCAYIPSQDIALGPVKERSKHLLSLHRKFKKQITEGLDLVGHYRQNNKFPARRGRQCSWCTIPKQYCGWAQGPYRN